MEGRNMGVKKPSATELIASKGIEGLMTALKPHLTPEEFISIQGPEFDESNRMTKPAKNGLTLVNDILKLLSNIAFLGIRRGIDEIELDAGSDFNIKEAQERLSQSTNSDELNYALHEYIDTLLVKIAFKLSVSDIERVASVIKKIVTFDKRQLTQSGETFNDIEKKNRSFLDASFLRDLEASL